MSESSESYHIRSSDTDAVTAGIQKARLSGIAFGPANGWLTFVPYAGSKRYVEAVLSNNFASVLVKAVSAPVLEYRYAEDFGWGFSFVSPDDPRSEFRLNWFPTKSAEDEKLDLSMLASLASLEELTQVLEQHDQPEARGRNPAYRFADALKLPAYRWLSPLLVEDDEPSYVEHGGMQIGTRPKRAYRKSKTSLVATIELPRPDLSAREAYHAVMPHLPHFGAGWVFHSLTGEGALSRNGRLSPKVGDWRFDFSRNGNAEYAWANLSPNGRLHVTSGRRFMSIAKTVPQCFELARDWMDSTDAARLAMCESPLAESAEELYLFMVLRSYQGTPPVWTVSTTLHQPGDWSNDRRHEFALDARTGALVAEAVSRLEGAAWVTERTRDRLNGGDWQTVGIEAD